MIRRQSLSRNRVRPLLLKKIETLMKGGELMVLSGIDVLVKKKFVPLKGASIGLLVNQASVCRNLTPTVELFRTAHHLKLKALFGPQHGIAGTTQDNMIEWESFKDRSTSLPVYSLYGEVRKPTPEMLKGIDCFVIDLFDIGARYYTFLWSALLALQACAEKGIRVVVLDRPNPINGITVEGPLLSENFLSFVGLYPLVIRHGMTIGEILSMIRAEKKIDVPLDIIICQGWKRGMWFDETGLPWVLPSPNMPALETATVYPGFCLLEGTTLSEGRGTTRPFELFGAPFVDSAALKSDLEREKLAGVIVRAASFEPTFQKHKGITCGGVQLHVTDRSRFRSVITAVAALKALKRRYHSEWSWKAPPYEYEYDKLPFDILAGGEAMRMNIENDTPLEEIREGWKADEKAFLKRRKPYLLYED
ncbi:MAG: exo-beta-N-acetylmuramidase NamZ domain-containing protein [Vulcanimicrobiota bacterium]